MSNRINTDKIKREIDEKVTWLKKTGKKLQNIRVGTSSSLVDLISSLDKKDFFGKNEFERLNYVNEIVDAIKADADVIQYLEKNIDRSETPTIENKKELVEKTPMYYRILARGRWENNLSWQGGEKGAINNKGESIEGQTMKDYIIHQCDKYITDGNVDFDYTHNGITGCTYFNQISGPDNVHKYWTADDIQQATQDGDFFAQIRVYDVNKKHVDVYGRAMIDSEGRFTDKVEEWVNYNDEGKPNYVKTKALHYQENNLTITKKTERIEFFNRLAEQLKLPSVKTGKENEPAMIAYSYIMATVYGRNWMDVNDDGTRNTLELFNISGGFRSYDQFDMNYGVSFSGNV